MPALDGHFCSYNLSVAGCAFEGTLHINHAITLHINHAILYYELATNRQEAGARRLELTVLKMDCEGCEWAALDILYAELPTFYNRIKRQVCLPSYSNTRARARPR